MPYQSALHIAVIVDSGRPIEELASQLTVAERLDSRQLPTARRRRHFVVGRLAARAAILSVPGARNHLSSIETLSEPEHAPRVSIDGRTDRIALSISHSSRIAIGGAWQTKHPHLISAGVDVEHVRPNQVADSRYAFSRRERKLLAQAQEGPEILALAAWTAKEAVWKALCAGQDIGPDAIDICTLSLEQGRTAVRVKGPLARRLGNSQLHVQTERFEGPDGMYVLSVAQVIPANRVIALSSLSQKMRMAQYCIATETPA